MSHQFDERDYLRELRYEIEGLRSQVTDLHSELIHLRQDRFVQPAPVTLGPMGWLIEVMAVIVIITCVVYWFR